MSVLLNVLLGAGLYAQQTVDAVAVISMPLERKVELTGELRPYLQVALRSPAAGVVEKVLVDTGSRVGEGDLLAVLSGSVEIRAPFAGIIAERYAHPGAIAGPSADPLFELQQNSRLRLVVPVGEEDAGSVPRGMVNFKVPAFPGTVFRGSVARNPGSLDPRTHTLPVEVDVQNRPGRLLPGMRATVTWPVLSQGSVTLVPPTAIAVSGKRTFVVRIRNGAAEWIDVVKGGPSGDLVMVQGGLDAGDAIARHATDQLRPGTRVQARVR
ncbi:MAG TPA: efflux RND transporter periplasmic adaptor subunit [Bryobacteraceae bacterium]|jgi:RND family efflux transporter MFP subunit|nr:efflux RND transporter periplasmic adaptor subunit [Bryobacteraceae bacterium]